MNSEMRGRDIFAKYKVLIQLLTKCISFLPLRTRIKLLEKNRNILGKKGLGIRYVLIKTIAADCGDNVAIYPGVYLLNPQNLSLGNNISIQPMSYLECGPLEGRNIVVGNDVSLAHGVTIMATTHLYSNNETPIKDQGVETKPVYIKDNVWIGAKATILCGITVESGCIIGANAIVTKSTAPDKIYAGIPARVIKERNTRCSNTNSRIQHDNE